MYKYLCVVCENSDKKAFYDAVSEIKALYRNCTEIPYIGSDESGIGQILSIPDKYGDNTKLYIKYECDKKRVVVLSETYLFKYYEGKKVDEVFRYSGKKFSMVNVPDIGLSIAFLIVDIIASAISFAFIFDILPSVIAASVLAVIYIISAFVIKKNRGISGLKTIFIQIGGIPFCIVLLGMIALLIINIVLNEWASLFFMFCIMAFFKTVPPALAVSGIIDALILRITKKSDREILPKGKRKLFGKEARLSLSFFVLNIIAAIIIYYFSAGILFEDAVQPIVIIIGSLAVIYMISMLKLNRDGKISFLKILFIQSGGYFTLIFFAASASLFSIFFEIAILNMSFFTFLFLLMIDCCTVVIPALVISGIITFIIEKIRIKLNRSNTP